MVKTLRITSILAVIAAAVLVKYFVFPIVVGTGSNERVGKVLDSPTVVEKFKETKGAHAKSTGEKTPPLVQQATAFARYLTPKPPVKPRLSGGPRTPTGAVLGPTSPKFTVYGTAYFKSNPGLSQALIDEPGRGRHWVRQSSMVGHLLIEQVKDGVVVVKSSKDTYELEVETMPQAAPVRRTSAGSKPATAQSTIKRTSPTYARAASGVSRTPSRAQALRTTSVSSEKADELVERLRDLKRSGSAVDSSRIDDLISRFKTTRANAEDANNLAKSSDKINSVAKDPNKASSMIKGGKIDADPTKPDAQAKK